MTRGRDVLVERNAGIVDEVVQEGVGLGADDTANGACQVGEGERQVDRNDLRAKPAQHVERFVVGREHFGRRELRVRCSGMARKFQSAHAAPEVGERIVERRM